MAEGDPRGNVPLGIAHIPRWVRVVILLLVGLLFALACAMLIVSATVDGRDNWSEPAAILAETAGTGLLILLVLFFVERARSPAALGDLTRSFLMEEVPQALMGMDVVEIEPTPWPRAIDMRVDPISRVALRVAHAEGSWQADYLVSLAEKTIRMSVQLNVRRFNVMYVIRGETDEDGADAAFATLADTWKGAREAGYTVTSAFEITGKARGRGRALGWPRSFAQTLHRDCGKGFLRDPEERRFVAQDLAIMTRSLFAERGLAPY